MDITKLNDSELADLATHLVTLLSGTELSAIESHLRADLVTAFGTLPASFAAKISAAAAANDEKLAAYSSKDQEREEILFLVSRTQKALGAGAAPDDQYALARLNAPATRSKEYIAKTPSEMSAVGFSNGVNKGTFKGNNKSHSIVYEIWRREGDTGSWHSHLLTKKQSFKDEAITPGQYYEYRVRAVAAQNVSDWSNSAVVYGVL